jgi:uncharacterized protein (DUF362 family)
MSQFTETFKKKGKISIVKKPEGIHKILFIIVGTVSLLWLLIRVIPKPSRVRYPCVKATMPIAYSFIAYLISLSGSVMFFRKAISTVRARQFRYGVFILFVALFFCTWAIVNNNITARADFTEISEFSDPLGPNSPIGEPKGIFPGRVVWVHDPDATNPDCDPDNYGDGYFLDANCDQSVVNVMVSQALKILTGTNSDSEAWDSIFFYFNRNHGKGTVDYTTGEKIFIKINSVHAWNTDYNGNISNNDSYGNVDTSPQVVYAMLSQLVNNAGVPQDHIYVGDPYTQMFNHCYDKWSADFPDIHYIVRSSSGMAGREVVTKSDMETIHYSDKGGVMDDAVTDDFVDCLSNADYLLNIPAFKAHRWGGVTFFGKNHFGSNSRSGADHLHKGLHRTDYEAPLRNEYYSYRVFVDLMASEILGGKTLIFLMDALWGTSEEHLPPAKFQTAPFNNHWSSSILASFDPVAVESVGLDILQKEFQVEDLGADPPRYTFVQWGAVDDYLHQAASSDWWPAGVTYDPDNTGSPIGSIGVHEHWNNITDMNYTRNLGTGYGIELIKAFQGENILNEYENASHFKVYPNPSGGLINIVFDLEETAKISLAIYTPTGNRVIVKTFGQMQAGHHEITLNTNNLVPGMYYCKLKTCDNSEYHTATRKIVVN